MAAASIRNSQPAEGTSTSFACAAPTVVADDVLYAFITADAGGTITPPAGWLRAPKMGGHTGRSFTGGNVWGYYKIADGTETGTITFENSDSRTFAMTIMSVQNVNTVYPFGYTRVGTDTADFALPNFFSVFDEGLGMMLFGYNSNVDESGASFTGGDAADWTLPISIDNSTLGLHVGVNSAGFATRIMTTGNGATTLNLAGTLSSAWALVMFNSLDQAPATVSGRLFRAVVSTAGSGSATLSSPSGEFESIGAWGRFFMPGVTILGAVGGRAAEAVTLSDWDTDNTGKVFTQVSGSPYDNTDASDTASMWAGYMTLEADDCYLAAEDVVHGTFSGSIHHQAVYGGYAFADSPSVTVGAFSSEETATTAPDPPSFSVGIDGSYAIVVSYGILGSSSPTGPAGYTDVVKENISASNQYIYMGEKAVNTGTEDPGALTTPSTKHVLLTLSLNIVSVDPPVNTVIPAVTPAADPDVNDVLTTTDGTWDNVPTSFTYQWQRSDDGVSAWSSIGGATANQYTVVAGDLAKFLRCVVTAINEGGSTPANSNVVGAIGAALTVTSPTFPQVNREGYFDEQSTTPSGGTSPYTYAVQSGALPTGLSLNASTGRITGVPTGVAGESIFVIRVTDADAQIEDTGSLSITVIVPILLIDTPRLPDGRVGSVYDTTIRASGGAPPYTFSVEDGALPAGLSLSSDGRITGTPTAAGGARVLIRVTDNDAATKDTWF